MDHGYICNYKTRNFALLLRFAKMKILGILMFLHCTVIVFTEENVPFEVLEDDVLTVPELIKQNGYPSEVHAVTTEDGYVLEMHRIPYGIKDDNSDSRRPVVLLMHGLISSSADYLLAGPGKSLGYLLADLGYDVWLGNARGNKYSRKHISLDPDTDKKEFWRFSWHEIGIYDLPAMIDYILDCTEQENLFHIGHSQGTTTFYVMASERPEYNQKIRGHFSLAPVAYMGHLFSPVFKFLAQFEGGIDLLLRMIGVYEWKPSNQFLAQFREILCNGNVSNTTEWVCSNYMFLLCGFNPEQMPSNLRQLLKGHTPAGAATRQFLHYAHNIKAFNKFRQYNYGMVKNLIKYNSIKPPKYDLSKVTAPVALFYSHNDWLSAETDVLKLYNELPNTIGRFLVIDEKFNHLDYLYAKDVVTLLYNKLFSLMNRF